MDSAFREHAEHGLWTKDGKCLYCTCGERLYQGESPGSIEKQVEIAVAFDEMVEAARSLHAVRVALDKRD